MTSNTYAQRLRPIQNRPFYPTPPPRLNTRKKRGLGIFILIFVFIVLIIFIIVIFTLNTKNRDLENTPTNVYNETSSKTDNGTTNSSARISNGKIYIKTDVLDVLGSKVSEPISLTCQNSGFISNVTITSNGTTNNICDIGFNCSSGVGIKENNKCTQRASINKLQGVKTVDTFIKDGIIIGFQIGDQLYGSNKGSKSTISCTNNDIFIGVNKYIDTQGLKGLQFTCGKETV